jgi:DNA invertase Pin-like site-specific DNA recombinase
MIAEANQKVTKDHLQRKAYLYIRQSSPQQVRENQESTRRQYALQERATELGWLSGRIVVIDDDQGQTGAIMDNRKGFQQLVAEVGLGNVGIVMGLEVSRLARNNADWHRLLEICGLTKTLILDEDGLYDPCSINDRILLGLKGTMSELEHHLIRARMQGGLLNKVQRGELYISLPVGFAFDSEGKVVLDPDKQVQQSIHLLFQTYRRVGSARGVAVYFQQQDLLFPCRRCSKNNQQQVWNELCSIRVVAILHNPAYAGAYVYGRTQVIRRADGSCGRIILPREQWKVLIKDAHEGYISWAEYEKNQKQLLAWSRAKSDQNKRPGPPREGCALLQGLAICGVCGRHMFVSYRYRKRDGHLIPKYECRLEKTRWGGPSCQYISGEGIDEAVGKLLMESVTPLTLEVALNVQKELQQRFEQADRIRRQQVERARYEVDLAQRRYMQVDPDNRLVAESLEAHWNEKLCALEKAKEEYERLCKEDSVVLNEKKQKEILALATDFPRLWQNPHVSDRERKRMIRLLIEDVTLLAGKDIAVHVRFKGGATKTISVPKSKTGPETTRTKPEVIQEIDHLLEHHIDREVADILNERGFRSSKGGLLFDANKVAAIQSKYHIKSRYERLRERGMLNVAELAKILNIHDETVRRWHKEGLLKRHAYTKNRYLFEPPVNEDYEKWKHFEDRTLLKNC